MPYSKSRNLKLKGVVSMIKLFTISKKGGNNGKDWNGANPQKFFPFMHKEGVKTIWDVRRTPNGMYGSFFDTEIMKWCCAHDNIKFEWRLDLAPEKEVFTACNAQNWDLLTYAKAYFTPQVIAALNKVENAQELDGVAILCAEQELYNCHRLLIAEYFKAKFPQISLKHLGLAYDRYGNEKNAVPYAVMHNTRIFIKKIIENN